MGILDVFSKKNQAVTKYKWKHHVKDNPSYDDFKDSWRVVFDCGINECININANFSDTNTGFTLTTPKGLISHGGFGEHTETPRLENTSDIIYSGCGCTWGTDLDGIRYYEIDKSTKLPYRFESAKAIETIRRYIANYTGLQADLPMPPKTTLINN